MNAMRTILVAAQLVATGAATALAQNPLGRLEAEIRQANGQPTFAAAPLPAGQRVYLGAVALDDLGRGVRITSVRGDSPAQRGGVLPQDLVIAANGSRVHTLRELTSILAAMNPGDKLAIDVLRGARTVQLQVVLGPSQTGVPQTGVPQTGVPQTGVPQTGVPHLAERPTPPPPTGQGAGPTETIPPPPTEAMIPPSPVEPSSGPALVAPQPVAPNNPQAQIDELRLRVEQLEQRVRTLERALGEAKK